MLHSGQVEGLYAGRKSYWHYMGGPFGMGTTAFQGDILMKSGQTPNTSNVMSVKFRAV